MKNDFFAKKMEAFYEFLKRSRVSVFLFPVQVRKDLQALNKSEKSYYVQKLAQLTGIVCLLMLIAVVGITSIYRSRNFTISTIERPKVDETSKEVILQVGETQTYTMEIFPREYTREEAEKQFSLLVTHLETHILGTNQSTMQITDNLVLPEAVEGYPFTIYWESDKEHLIDNMGTVCREDLTENELVTLTAICTYMEYQWEQLFCVQLMKEEISEDALYQRNLEKYLLEDEEGKRTSEQWELPGDFQGEELQYTMVEKADKVIVLGILLLAAGMAIWFGSDKDLRNNRKKQQEQYEEEYLNFVSSFSLYISAGLNLQTAMNYCVKDYMRRKPQGNMLRETLLNFEKDILNGNSFQRALDNFANRADHVYYRRLASLLHQGLMNGSADLARTLQQEVDKIREDKRRQSKVKGEKISTALIAPMMLQLCVVIAFIMCPAFTNMQF